ncbi:glycosyltransferase family A protein [Algoriphagus sp. D3-2-R+10]|uniref:glycosyltransferase family A protein n=1 Tax=Algoriphagus aurantiacus TaxID=3103948 RepID=UPI002B3AB858|nr:glycosyltransferase family A protein [Algoriphagus sp. D3-2-R+10]MEB2777507.1 glycosyltransferase family A protein [Algoriphagus sp. D3-2-R+10]
MNEDPTSFKRLAISTLVISQNATAYEESSQDFMFLSFNERGLSKSRNRAIGQATAKFALIADDDVSFCENFEKKIETGFKQFPDADILTFKILTPSGEAYKKYAPNAFKHDRSSIYKVSSVEIVIRPDRVRNAGLQFDENFGLGAVYPSSEEMIFLNDALNKGLNIYFIPEYIVVHPVESSGKILDRDFYRSKGALIRRLYGSSMFLCIGIAFLIKQILKPQRSISLLSSIKESVKGFNSITNE